MMAASDFDADTKLRLDVVTLAQELAVEALGKDLSNTNGIYTCFASYLQRKIEDRDASRRVFAKAAWSEEARFIKELHQTASQNESSTSFNFQRPRSSSLIASHQNTDSNSDFDVRLEIDEDHESGDFTDASRSSSFSSELLVIQTPDVEDEYNHKSPNLNSQVCLELAEDDSGLGASDGVTAEKNEPDHIIQVRSQGSPNTVQRGGVLPKGGNLGKEGSQEAKFEDDPEKVEDLCTFAFFSSTVEDNRKPRTEVINENDPDKRSLSSLTSDSDMSFVSGHGHELLIMELDGHKSTVTQCCLMESLLMTSSRDGTLKIWSVKSGNLLRTLNCKRPVHDFRVLTRTEGCFYLIMGCEDGAIVLMKIVVSSLDSDVDVQVKLSGEYSGHLPNPIRAMAISPNGHRLASGCCFLMNQIKLNRTPELVCRGTLKTWNLDEMISASEQEKFYDGAPLNLKTMRQLVANCIKRKTSYHRFSRDKADHKEEETHGVRAIAYTPDGTMLVVGFGQPEDIAVVDRQMVVIVNADNLNTLWTENTDLCQINDIHFLPTKPDDAFSMVVSTQSSTSVATFNQAESGKIGINYRWTESVSEYLLRSDVSPKGDMTVSCYKYSLRFRSTHNGEEIYRIHKAHSMPTTCVCFSPGGELVCSGSRDGIVRVWNTPKPPKLQRLDLLARKRTAAPSASNSKSLLR